MSLFIKFFTLWSISTSIIFAESKTLKVALPNDEANTISQITQRPGQSRFIQEVVAPSVVSLDELWNWSCKLCTKIPSEDDTSYDKANTKFPYSIHWSLKPDIFWGDGIQVTAKDVKFTLLFLKRFTNIFYKTRLPNFKITTSKNDELSFFIHFESKRYDAAQLLAISLLPAHKSKDIETIFQSLKEETASLSNIYENLIMKNKFFLDPGLYYGPFHPALFAEQVILKENTFYKNPSTEFNEIEVKFFKDSNQITKLLASESVDFVAEGAIDVSELNSIKLPNTYRVQSNPGANLEQLIVNLRNPILSDSIIRQSLYRALNLNTLRAQAFSGYGAPAQSILGPNEALRKPKPINTKVDNLIKTLAANGWQPTEDGIRSKLGKRLSFEILIDQSNHSAFLASLIQKAWRDIGVETNIVKVSSKTLLDRLIQRRFSGLALQTYPHHKDSFWPIRFHSTSIPDSDNSYQGLNFMSWKHKQADELLTSILQETDKTLLSTHYQSLDELILDQLPIMPLVYRPQIMIIHDRLTNVLNPGHLFSSSSFAAGWRLQEKSPIIF